MARKHGRTPAYEIMRSVGSGTPLPRSRVRNVRGGSVGLLGLTLGGIKAVASKFVSWPRLIIKSGSAPSASNAASNGGGLIAAATKPVELRLPWALVALLSVTFVASLGLMFQIGQHVANRSVEPTSEFAQNSPPATAENTINTENQGVTARTDPPAPAADPTLAAADPTISPMDGDLREFPGGEIVYHDKRAVGLNYFILSTVPANLTEDVRELQKFLAEHGLETYLDKADNRGQRVLVDVTRGYTREERASLLHFDHERRIRQLGKMWKAQNNGRGTDLRDIYADRFDGASDLNN